ncbi:hypothetical protein MED193_20174 [Roseobacter sp. MED193]|nr:hypothetical protein MED193_20174 [Roseobacter sp. MED193]
MSLPLGVALKLYSDHVALSGNFITLQVQKIKRFFDKICLLKIVVAQVNPIKNRHRVGWCRWSCPI